MACAKNSSNIRCYSTGYNQAVAIATANKVDLTDYNYLKVNVTIGSKILSTHWTCSLRINTDCNGWGSCTGTGTYTTISENQTGTFLLNISEYSGLYYPHFLLYYVGDFYMYQMWLEK